jgi:hypothetical protein
MWKSIPVAKAHRFKAVILSAAKDPEEDQLTSTLPPFIPNPLPIEPNAPSYLTKLHQTYTFPSDRLLRRQEQLAAPQHRARCHPKKSQEEL